MADSLLNEFVGRGTTTQRLAFTPTPPTPASGPSPGYLWWDVTLQAEYAYDFASSSWVVTGGGTGTVTHTGSLTANRIIKGNGTADITVGDLTGDVTTSGAMATTIANSAVTLAKIANAAASSKLVGSGASGSGAAYAELTLGTNLSMSGTTLNATGGGSGAVVQVVNAQTGAVATGATVIPLDDTIPQNTEGDQYMSLAITPTSASNKLRIDVVVFGSVATAAEIAVALFQDSTANALAVTSMTDGINTARLTIPLTHYMTSGTTSATTFKVRVGPSSVVGFTFNGTSGGRLYGGVAASSITITEIVP